MPVTPVKTETSAVGVALGCVALQIRTGSDGMRLKHQPPWSLHALSNSADATSRSASAKRQRVRMESLERSIRQIHSPASIGGSLDPAIALRGGKIVQIA